MKTTVKKMFALMMFLLIPFILSAQDKNKNLETIRFKTSIDCEDCVNTIMSNIPREKGVKNVECNLESREVKIEYRKDRNNAGELRKSIEKLGYTAVVVQEEKPEEKKQDDNAKGLMKKKQ